jgi:glycerol-3-phosphate acyltransferase PlsY
MAVCLLAAIVAYLLGAVPFGLIVALSRGIDVRKVGSGNIGATNVFRTVGKPWGILAFALDFLKGFAAAAWVPGLVARIAGVETPACAPLVCGVCAVVGHTWPVWLRFKGGKGVATGAGMLVAIVPHAALCAVGAWLVFFLATRYVSFASIMAALLLCVHVWMPPKYDAATSIALTLLAFAVILRHRSNIVRLGKGTESRFSFTRAQKERENARRAAVAAREASGSDGSQDVH